VGQGVVDAGVRVGVAGFPLVGDVENARVVQLIRVGEVRVAVEVELAAQPVARLREAAPLLVTGGTGDGAIVPISMSLEKSISAIHPRAENA
jgi:hypothetical protein